MDKSLVYTSDETTNWFHKKYYYGGANARYWTFQTSLNLLQQMVANPIIIETGCQRQKDDLGGGMSTLIFGEFCQRYNGELITVDIVPKHLVICKECTEQFADSINYVLSDSVQFLAHYKSKCDLLYLDSLDYPIGTDEGNVAMQEAAQVHCLNEFQAIEQRLNPRCFVLIDDNQLNGGGKPKLLKEYLIQQGWLCMLDFQQSLWCRRI